MAPRRTRARRHGRRRPGSALALIIGFVAVCLAAPVRAETPQERLIERARAVLAAFVEEGGPSGLPERLRAAAGVLIVPSLIKAGFILGAEGGDGVMLAHRADGTWSAPAFYVIGAGSFGLQAGIQQSDVIFVINSRRALDAVIESNLKLGGDAAFAAGPVGRGIEGSTTAGLGGDIIAYSRGEGLFLGGALEGAVITPKTSWNLAYYRTAANPREILFDRRVGNLQAQGLQRLLAGEAIEAAPHGPGRL